MERADDDLADCWTGAKAAAEARRETRTASFMVVADLTVNNL
jgi:hypothetical protein